MIKNILGALRNKMLERLMPVIDYNIGGKKIKALRGTIRKKTDQDDAWINHLLKRSEVFFDIGCNVGYISLLGLLQKDLRVVMVDPSKAALKLAAQNLISNSISQNVSLYHAFVADKAEKEVNFYSTGWEAAGSMYASHAETAAKSGNSEKIRTVTIDYLSAYYQLIPDLVKIDVEGAELLVLDGSIQVAKQLKTLFIIEMHALKERSMKESGDYVVNWCSKQGYTPYYLQLHTKLTSGDMIASRGKCHLLLCPKSTAYPEGLDTIQVRSELGF